MGNILKQIKNYILNYPYEDKISILIVNMFNFIYLTTTYLYRQCCHLISLFFNRIHKKKKTELLSICNFSSFFIITIIFCFFVKFNSTIEITQSYKNRLLSRILDDTVMESYYASFHFQKIQPCYRRQQQHIILNISTIFVFDALWSFMDLWITL